MFVKGDYMSNESIENTQDHAVDPAGGDHDAAKSRFEEIRHRTSEKASKASDFAKKHKAAFAAGAGVAALALFKILRRSR